MMDEEIIEEDAIEETIEEEVVEENIIEETIEVVAKPKPAPPARVDITMGVR